MRQKLLIFAVFLSSLFGFLAWGNGQTAFLAEMEWDLIQKMASNPLAVIHPFTVLPMVGQLLLLIALVQKRPSRVLVWLGCGLLFVLLGFMSVIGLLAGDLRIFSSTLPFLVLSVIAIRYVHNKRATS